MKFEVVKYRSITNTIHNITHKMNFLEEYLK
jgi:hypothetical protein